MGTRSLTKFIEEDGKPFFCFYRQFDGYPSGHGLELAEFLSGYEVINGIGMGQETGKFANGMGCLAAQCIKHFKEGIGGFYIMHPDAKDCWQEYEYYVSLKNKKIHIKCGDFEGDTKEFLEWCKKDE